MTDRQRCAAHKKPARGGGQCQNLALPGGTVCRWHGGNTPQARAKAKLRVERAEAEKAVAVYGLPRDIDPHTALLEEIARTAGHVDWLARVVANLDQTEITWGLHSTEIGVGPEGPIDKTTSQAGINVWVEMYQRERKHLVDVCKAAIAAGIAERQVRLAEAQGALIAEILRQVIADPELALEPARQEVARRVAARHLRALPPAS